MTKQEAHFEPNHKKGDEVMEITLIAKCDRCKEAKLLDFNSPLAVYDILRNAFALHSVIEPIPNTDKTTTRNVYLCPECDKQLNALRKQAKDNEAAFYKGEEPCKQSSKTK